MKSSELLSEELLSIKLMELIEVLTSLDDKKYILPIFRNLFNPKESKFTKIIHSDLYQDLSLDHLAFLTSMSISSFKRKFKSVFNVSPLQYIKAKRLERAKYLLEPTKLNITEVAYESGFNDLSYFTKSFTTAYQISPSDFRDSI